LVACGGAPAASPPAAPKAAEPTKPAAAAEAARPAAAATTAPAAGAAQAPAPSGAAKPGAPAATAAATTNDAAPGRVAGAAGALPALDQKIIRTGKMEMIVPSIPAALESISILVANAGGFTQQSATKEQGADLVLRVPVEQYDPVFRELRKLAVQGTRIIESSEAQDVTEQYADTEARITNLKATEVQLLKLLAKAEKMEDILVVQREVTGVREQIERLQGQLNVLGRRAAFSTIAVALRPQEEARKPAPPPLVAPIAHAIDVGVRPTFAWGTSAGATWYDLQVTTEIDTTFANPLLTADKLTATSYEWPTALSDLNQGASYRWRVRAANAAGEGEWAAARAFTTVPAWTPLRTITESWTASMAFLQRLIDVVLRIVIFFWWLILLVALGLPLLRRFGWGRWRGRAGGSAPPPPPPPAGAPPGA
jgi:hypothetical protein